MEGFTEQPKEIHTLDEVKKMTILQFIAYLKREGATPSQVGIANHLDNQFHGIIGEGGVTQGFIRTGINALRLPGVLINDKKEAEEILKIMKNNK